MLAILMAEKMSGTSVKIIKNEVGCGDDPVPKAVARRIESMQQSSATPSLHLFLKIVASSQSSSQCLLVSTVFGTGSSLHSTSFLMTL